ncbi:MAG: DUF4330 domain-containing protein [Actinomycetota bacterium]|jgi:hypothetical protein|nr:DUF4330 domain-containing protein [Actinomycetota bacterium]
MTDTASGRDKRLIALTVLGALVVIGGLGLGLLGIGAELQQERQVLLTVRAIELAPEVAATPAVGDPVFTDPAGMLVGEVISVKAGPYLLAVPDAQGNLHTGEDPTLMQVDVVLKTTGREGEGIVTIGNTVVQAGQTFNAISREYYLRGTVVSVDVR